LSRPQVEPCSHHLFHWVYARIDSSKRLQTMALRDAFSGCAWKKLREYLRS
jgi:hypothetical protein